MDALICGSLCVTISSHDKGNKFCKGSLLECTSNIHSPTVEARAALQNSTYSKGSTCLTLNTVTLSLFTSNVFQTSKVALSAEITARLKF